MTETRIPSIAVLMSCFNRRESTLRCLQLVFSQQQDVLRAMSVTVVDDGSTDGTAEAVKEAFPQVKILWGDGTLFYSRGMRFAFAAALSVGYDYYLWLNDDTLLYPHALDTMLRSGEGRRAAGNPAIIVGSTCDEATGKLSYGGQIRRRDWKGNNLPVEPRQDSTVPCDTMNGNCVLIPSEVAAVIGNIDPVFHHWHGDKDYGFRARNAGFDLFVAPGFVGTCSTNSAQNTWRDGRSTFRQRWRNIRTPKGLPVREWFIYTKRHYGPLWPLYFLVPYARVLTGTLPRLRR